MEKLYLDNTFSSSAVTSGTKPRSSGSDAATRSSCWRETFEKKRDDKTENEPPKEMCRGSFEEKNFIKKKPGKIKQATVAMGKANDPLDEKLASSPFDLLSQLEEDRSAGLPFHGLSELEDPELVSSPCHLLSQLEEKKSGSDKMVSIFSLENSELHESKKAKGVKLHQDKSQVLDTSLLASSLTGASEITGISSTGEAAIGAMISGTALEQIDDLINQLANEISILTVSGKTETTIEIKNVPLFNGAKVTLTEFDSAKKEFNIKLENLSTKAHEIISMQSSRESLKSALEQRGYNVHIITANTEIEKAEETFKAIKNEVVAINMMSHKRDTSISSKSNAVGSALGST